MRGKKIFVLVMFLIVLVLNSVFVLALTCPVGGTEHLSVGAGCGASYVTYSESEMRNFLKDKFRQCWGGGCLFHFTGLEEVCGYISGNANYKTCEICWANGRPFADGFDPLVESVC